MAQGSASFRLKVGPAATGVSRTELIYSCTTAAGSKAKVFLYQRSCLVLPPYYTKEEKTLTKS